MANIAEIKNKTIGYLKDVRAEARKVVWPDRKYVIAATIIVLIVIFIAASLIILMDLGLSEIFSKLLNFKAR